MGVRNHFSFVAPIASFDSRWETSQPIAFKSATRGPQAPDGAWACLLRLRSRHLLYCHASWNRCSLQRGFTERCNAWILQAAKFQGQQNAWIFAWILQLGLLLQNQNCKMLLLGNNALTEGLSLKEVSKTAETWKKRPSQACPKGVASSCTQDGSVQSQQRSLPIMYRSFALNFCC